MLLTTHTRTCEIDDYLVDSQRVAEAMLTRIRSMADERARLLQAVAFSVEMLEAPDLAACAA